MLKGAFRGDQRGTQQVDPLKIVARSLTTGYKPYAELRPGTETQVYAPKDAVFGTPVLIASQTGRHIDALAVVVGSGTPTHYKHKKSVRIVFVAHRLPQSDVDLPRPLTGRSNSRAASPEKFGDARGRASQSRYAHVLEAALRLPAAKQTQERRCARDGSSVRACGTRG